MPRWPVSRPSEYWLLASSPATKVCKTAIHTHTVKQYTWGNKNTHNTQKIPNRISTARSRVSIHVTWIANVSNIDTNPLPIYYLLLLLILSHLFFSFLYLMLRRGRLFIFFLKSGTDVPSFMLISVTTRPYYPEATWNIYSTGCVYLKFHSSPPFVEGFSSIS